MDPTNPIGDGRRCTGHRDTERVRGRIGAIRDLEALVVRDYVAHLWFQVTNRLRGTDGKPQRIVDASIQCLSVEGESIDGWIVIDIECELDDNRVFNIVQVVSSVVNGSKVGSYARAT